MTKLEQRLAEIRARVEKATPGPWFVDHPGGAKSFWSEKLLEGSPVIWTNYSPSALGSTIAATPPTCVAEADLIAHAPSDISLLLQICERLIKCVEWYSDTEEWFDFKACGINPRTNKLERIYSKFDGDNGLRAKACLSEIEKLGER